MPTIEVQPAQFSFGQGQLDQFPAVFFFSTAEVDARAHRHNTAAILPAEFQFAAVPLRALIAVTPAPFQFQADEVGTYPRARRTVTLGAARWLMDGEPIVVRAGAAVATVAGTINVRDGDRWLRLLLAGRGIQVFRQTAVPSNAQPGDIWIIP
jgi:hypothetical protein